MFQWLKSKLTAVSSGMAWYKNWNKPTSKIEYDRCIVSIDEIGRR